MGHVDRERGQDREDHLPEVRAEPVALVTVEVRPADQLDALGGELGLHLLGEAARVPGDQLARLLRDQLQLGAQRDLVAAAHRQAGLEAALQPGDPDHVELVEVAREDRQELGPLQQRRVRVFGEGEHPGVEVQPGQFPVEEPVLGQRVGRHELVVRRRAVRVVGAGLGLRG
ncbi:hypothetical protein Psuf_048450 [Phytohabitans suffuscus]|uniref:Uncharacterized protein n=1 Tax=Phytohabitans suffuscus TaxID=624315 RepID=A0A6F8YN46_9ACTN|nr:hypothetical protein Psuf_048450 [Phytohabitans suffuscus]